MSGSFVDLGDPLPDLSVNVYDSSGALADATSVTLTITLPDGTTSSPAVSHPSTGVYSATYFSVQSGRHVASWVASGSNASAFRTVYNVADSLGGLVVLSDMQAFLGASAASSQDDVRACILVASDAVEKYTGRKWRRQTVTETYDGGRTALNLRSTPVLSVTSVTESGSTVTSGNYVLDAQAGLLHRGTTAGTWPWMPGVQNVTVTYVVGQSNVPDPIVYACKQVVSTLWAERNSGGKRSQPDDYAGPTDLIPRPVRMLLDPYRAPGF